MLYKELDPVETKKNEWKYWMRMEDLFIQSLLEQTHYWKVFKYS